MLIPPGKTEQEVLDAIERTVNILAKRFSFGYYDIDDIKQYGRMMAIDLMNGGKYDPSRPLENFIHTHVYKRYLNLRRNLLMRSDPPCKKCHSGARCVPGGCVKYERWRKRNMAKANLMRPVEMDESHDSDRSGEVDVSDEIDSAAMMKKIDLLLPVELRLTWKQILDGVKVPKAKRDAVQLAVQEILDVSATEEESCLP